MNQCAFCGTKLGTDARTAKEHILKQSWIKKMGHTKTPMTFSYTNNKGELIGSRQHGPLALVAGEVCETCNSGWMNQVDQAVEPVLLGLASGNIAFGQLDYGACQALSVWLLKAGCAFILTDKKDRRHVPESVYRDLRNHRRVPPGFALFGGMFPIPNKHIAAATINMWFCDKETKSKVEAADHFKFGVQYDRLLIGCAFISASRPIFLGGRVHEFLMLNDANWGRHHENDDVMKLPTNVADSALNRFLFTLSVTF